MRLRFLEMVGARCACTVGLSSGAELGDDGVVVEVVGHEVAQGYRPTAMLRDGGRGGTSSLVQACVVAICRWAVVPRRAAEVCSAARAASAADTGRAELCLKVCARARVLAVVGRRTMSTAQVDERILNLPLANYSLVLFAMCSSHSASQ